jgi:hypothetical protein
MEAPGMSARKLLVLLLVLFLLASSCGNIIPETVSGSGKTETRNFDLSGFSGIQAGAAFVIRVDREASYKVQITADDNLWDKLDISRSGSTLHLQTKRAVNVNNASLTAIVTLPSLNNLDLSGAARGTVRGFSSNGNLSIKVSGAGDLNIDNLNYDSAAADISGGGSFSGSAALTDAKFTISGAGRVNLSGSGTSATINASGGAQIILDQFKLQKVSAVLSGASEARVNTQTITTADLSGASRLYYVDSPALGKIQTSGGSTIGQE